MPRFALSRRTAPHGPEFKYPFVSIRKVACDFSRSKITEGMASSLNSQRNCYHG
jgi:hypothetical protein